VHVGLLPLRTAELRRRARDGDQIAEIAGLLLSRRLGGIGEGTEAPVPLDEAEYGDEIHLLMEIAPDLA
jgi:hypothetical protein